LQRIQHSTTFAQIPALAIAILTPYFAGTDPKTAKQLVRILLFAAFQNISIFSAANLFKFLHLGAETARRLILKALNVPDNFPRLDDQILRSIPLPRRLRKRAWPCAIDFHELPYYGDRDTHGIRGGQRKASTNRFWTYASLIICQKHRFHTVAVIPVPKGANFADIVDRLVELALAEGLKIQYLLLDRGFYAADVILALQRRKVPFVMLVPLRGTKVTGTCQFFQPGATRYETYSYKPRIRVEGKQRRTPDPISITLGIVWEHGLKKYDGKPMVFATDTNRRPLKHLVSMYRRRFAIESTYRMMHLLQGLTTSKNAALRLLFVVLAFLLLNLWFAQQCACNDPLRKEVRGEAEAQLSRFILISLISLCPPELIEEILENAGKNVE
jgi:putative transposase